MRSTYWAALLMIGSVVMVGCTEGGAPVHVSKDAQTNLQGAADHADSMLDATLAAVKPTVQWVHGTTTIGSCDLTRRRAVMTKISESRRGAFLGVVEKFWRRNSYTIKSVNTSAKYPAIYAQSPEGYGISLSVGVEGQAFFEVDSPCVARSGVREGASEPDGPVPRPDVYDDFWSSSGSAPASSPSAL